MSTQDLFVAAKMAALQELQIDCANLQVQTQIVDQSLAITLWQLCYGKISFIVLFPDGRFIESNSRWPNRWRYNRCTYMTSRLFENAKTCNTS